MALLHLQMRLIVIKIKQAGLKRPLSSNYGAVGISKSNPLTSLQKLNECIVPKFAVRINQAIIFFIIFVCMLFLNILDEEGHPKRMQMKRDLK